MGQNNSTMFFILLDLFQYIHVTFSIIQLFQHHGFMLNTLDLFFTSLRVFWNVKEKESALLNFFFNCYTRGFSENWIFYSFNSSYGTLIIFTILLIFPNLHKKRLKRVLFWNFNRISKCLIIILWRAFVLVLALCFGICVCFSRLSFSSFRN